MDVNIHTMMMSKKLVLVVFYLWGGLNQVHSSLEHVRRLSIKTYDHATLKQGVKNNTHLISLLDRRVPS